MSVFSFVKAGKKIYGTIKSVKPALGKSKLKKAVDDVKLSSLKTKGKMKRSFQKMEEDIDPARKKLRQTTQKLKGEKVTESGVSKGKDLRENKMGGGMMGRRMGYSQGKLAVTPREKQLAAQYGDKKRITRGDVITAAKNKSGKRMQAKEGTKPFNEQKSIIDKQGKRGIIVETGTMQKAPSKVSTKRKGSR